jgi:outer membrane PBP1 activator LpoA protein
MSKRSLIIFICSSIFAGCTTTTPHKPAEQYERNQPIVMNDNVKEWQDWEHQQDLKRLRHQK